MAGATSACAISISTEAAPGKGNGSALSPGSSLDPTVNPLTRGEGYPDRTMDTEDIERGFRACEAIGQVNRTPGGLRRRIVLRQNEQHTRRALCIAQGKRLAEIAVKLAAQ